MKVSAIAIILGSLSSLIANAAGPAGRLIEVGVDHSGGKPLKSFECQSHDGTHVINFAAPDPNAQIYYFGAPHGTPGPKRMSFKSQRIRITSGNQEVEFKYRVLKGSGKSSKRCAISFEEIKAILDGGVPSESNDGAPSGSAN